LEILLYKAHIKDPTTMITSTWQVREVWEIAIMMIVMTTKIIIQVYIILC